MAGLGQPSVVGLAAQDDNGLVNHAVRMVSPPPVTLPTETTLRRETAARAEEGRDAEPKPTMLRSSLATSLVALFFLTYVFFWNLSGVSSFSMPERLVPLGPLLGLDQYWAMFAPHPPKGDVWHVIPGNLQDGRQVDLLPVASGDFSLHELSWQKPPRARDLYKNEHWRKYLENLGNDQFTNQRLYFGRYICREWNARHSGAEELRTFRIAQMWQPTPPHSRQQPASQETVLWEHRCF
jgi:hypothetical protein